MASIRGRNHLSTSSGLSVLSSILQMQGKLDNEVKDLLERCLAIIIKGDAFDSVNVSSGNM